MSLLWPVPLHLLSPSGEVMEERTSCEEYGHDYETEIELYSTGELYEHRVCLDCGDEYDT